MSSEKIAFIFPTAKDAEGREGPILNFQCAALPVEMKLAIAAAFVGLQQSKNYLISIDVTDRNGTTVLNGQAKEIPVKIPVTANDPEAEPTDVPGFLSISVLTRVANTGVHIYPTDFKMHRDGKGVNPREHSKLCDRGERVQPTKRQLER
ncbi:MULTISPECIES: hypothetical protein [Photorhabdus]|uniref:Cadherin domain-containing protein n=1 Tax=Photorhabdus bodei TaxID=2029681 RepID=A0AAW6BLP5_9GAMM|nr:MULTISPECIES: hypothetical protein [Photorhabdus]MCT8351801.1 hypothetical protein [Photorhabdus kayaii]MDB6373476.1 hypothetical protein [Photorhabdus bodei]